MVSRKNIKNRVRRAVTASFLGFTIKVSTQLIQVPLFLFFWTPGYYGEWLLLYAVPAYLALSDFGISMAGGNAIAKSVARGDRSEAAELYTATLTFVSTSNVVIAGICLITYVLTNSELQHFFKYIETTDLGVAYIFLALSVIASMQIGVSSAVLRGVGRYAEQSLISSALIVGDIGAIAIALFANPTAGCVAFSIFLTRWVILVGVIFWVRLLAPDIQKIAFHNLFKNIKLLLKPGIAFLAFPIGNAINLQGFNILVGSVFGPIELVLFSTIRIMVRFIDIVLDYVAGIIGPEAAYATGRRDYKSLHDLHDTGLVFSILIAASMTTILLALGPFVYETWTLGELEFPLFLFLILAFGKLIRAFWSSGAALISGMNMHIRLSVVSLTIQLVCLAFALVAARISLQIWVVAMCIVLVEILFAWFVSKEVLRVTHDSFRELRSRLLNRGFFISTIKKIW